MSEVEQQLRIGIAEGALLYGPGQIVTAGLGSCVGLVLYDDRRDVAGMVHIMLPTAPKPNPIHPQKYADTAIPWLFDELLRVGAQRPHIKAKLAGGAQMFRNLQTEALRIGDRNLQAATELLDELQIPVVAQDVGGHYGRTVRFELPSRVFFIRTAKGEQRQI
ncbi:chemoreceptor glutamine deamidase CheD [Alicyclobacillus acidoterrestris]|nr:chemoreceptor glutamine deamidase CheD [Alicyclobacillus acidoterrestris]